MLAAFLRELGRSLDVFVGRERLGDPPELRQQYDRGDADNYSPIFADTEVPADLTSSAPVANAVSNETTGNTARFFIERRCIAVGPAEDTACLGGKDNLHFRVTTRVDGPRNTFTLAQATFGLEPAATVARRAWRSVNL